MKCLEEWKRMEEVKEEELMTINLESQKVYLRRAWSAVDMVCLDDSKYYPIFSSAVQALPDMTDYAFTTASMYLLLDLFKKRESAPLSLCVSTS
jgi:hypothetical protein